MHKLTYLIAAIVILGLTSCAQECQDCECPLNTRDQVCRIDYDSQEEYENALATNEATGCTCSPE